MLPFHKRSSARKDPDSRKSPATRFPVKFGNGNLQPVAPVRRCPGPEATTQREDPLTRIVVGAVLIVIVLMIAAVLARQLFGKRGVHLGCDTPACLKYVKELNETLQSRVLACRNFYEYVCGGRRSRRAQSVRDRVFEEFRTAIVQHAWTLKASTSFQTPVEKAAKLYTSCARLVRDHLNEVPEIKNVLKNSTLSWPQKTASANILSTVMTLSKHWPWLFIARAELVPERRGSNGERSLLVTSSPEIPTLLAIRQRIISTGEHEKVFNRLRNIYLVDEETSITYSEHLEIEEVVVEALLNAQTASVADQVTITRKSISSITAPGILSEDWTDVLNNVFRIPREEEVIITIKGVKLFMALIDLLHKLGPLNSTMYIGWYVVQMASIYTDSDIMLYYYGSKDQVVRSHLSLCFRVVQTMMGYAFNSEYAMTVAPSSVRADVSAIVENIRLSFDDLLRKVTWFPLSSSAASHFKEQTRLFEYVEKSAPENLTGVFGNFEDMTATLTLNMNAANKGYRLQSPELFSPSPYRATEEGSATYSALQTSRLSNADDFMLMPYALAFPLYLRDAPSSIKYATLGSEVATLFSRILYRRIRTWNESSQNRALEEIRCFLKRHVDLSDLSYVEWTLVYRISSLSVLWNAYRKARAKEGPIYYLRGLRGIDDDQLFFIFWCYVHCGEQLGQHACNRPLKHSGHFRKAFGCDEDSPMYIAWQCEFFKS